MGISTDLDITFDLIKHQPYHIEGLWVHICPIPGQPEGYSLKLEVEPEGQWEFLVKLSIEDPEGFNEWTKKMVEQLGRAVEEGLDRIDLPVPRLDWESEEAPESTPEPAPGAALEPKWWEKVFQSFGRRPAAGS
jgi:hypothetical protein